MPPCNCISSRCGGTQRDQRTFDKHAVADYRLGANKARVEALAKTDNAISSFVSSMSLADKASGPSTRSGGKLWSLSPANGSDAEILDAHFNANKSEGVSPLLSGKQKRSERAELLDRLKIIEKNLDSLAFETTLTSESLDFATSPAQPYPLESNLQSARNLRADLQAIKAGFVEIQAAKESILERLDVFMQNLQEDRRLWVSEARKQKARAADEPLEYNAEHHHLPVLEGVNPVIQVMVFTIVALQVVSKVAHSACRFVLEMMGYVVKLAILGSQHEISPQTAKLLHDLPVDPGSATSKFGLDGKSTVYAICPDPGCHRSYKPQFRDGCPIAEYPKYCENRRFSNSPICGTILTRPRIVKDVEIQIPIKELVSFDFKDWLAGLVSRPGYEDLMDGAWLRQSSTDELRDAIDGDYLRNFKGPDGKKLFGDEKNEGRYIFTLCVDFFNPYTNKQAGKKASIGIISLACLSLPPEERYKPENMFLAGIVPGPTEPPLNTLNHYLTPLVDSLLEFWEPGVRYSRTYNFPSGRTVRCALVAVVCDLPGARKVAGFASFKHQHFCSVCHCTRAKEGYGCTNYESWKFRTDEECRKSTAAFLAALDETSQQTVFDASGIRYSELSRLPYFDLVRCLVVDAMHNLFLGLIKEHFRNIIGVGRRKTEEDAVVSVDISDPPADFTENERKSLKQLQKLLQRPLNEQIQTSSDDVQKKLQRMHNRALAFACFELEVEEETTFIDDEGKAVQSKKTCAEKLLSWRFNQMEQRDAGSETSTRLGQVLTEEELGQIWSDLSEITTPTWISPVPLNLGSASHGKLKADQWRTLGVTHLPLSLIKLWGLRDSDGPRSRKCREILDVTISLISAVVLASSRTTSPAIATAYLSHMKAYMEGVKKLFPQYKFHPNHHMSLHLYDYLRLFGPVHSWWTFPFERVIGMLERIPTNFKVGQLEKTISQSFTRSANLRAFAYKPNQCPRAILDCQPIFGRLIDPRLRHTLSSDLFTSAQGESEWMWNPRVAKKIPTDTQEALLRYNARLTGERAQFLTHLELRGLRYSTSANHFGNSCVLLKLDPISSGVPAVIQSIFKKPISADSVGTFVAVRRFKTPPQTFPQYSLLGFSVWSLDLRELEIFEPKDIESHFAALKFKSQGGRRFISVISLSRISPPVDDAVADVMDIDNDN